MPALAYLPRADEMGFRRLAQVLMPVALATALFGCGSTIPSVDPAVDEARFYIEQDLLYSRRIRKIGLVEGVGSAPADAPRTNAEGDPYFTDGQRAVFFIGSHLNPIDKLEVLNWSLPPELEPYRENIFELAPDGRERLGAGRE